MCSKCLAICSNWSATFSEKEGGQVYSQRQCQTICPALLTVSDLKLLHVKNKLHCFLFTVRSVSCSQFTVRDFYVATFRLDLQIKSSHYIAPAGLWRTCPGKIIVSHHLTQPTTILLHLFHGALTFLIGKLGAFTTNCSWAQTQSCLHYSLCKTSEPPGFCPTRCLLEFPKCAGISRCPVQVSTRSSPAWSWWNWCSLQSGSTWHFHFLATALGHDIAGTAHQLSHWIFVLQEKFFPPSDKPEGIIFQPILKPIDVELHGDKASYFTVGE